MKILNSALRQYRHNDRTKKGFVFGYDKKETEKIVEHLLTKLNALQLFTDNLADEFKKLN